MRQREDREHESLHTNLPASTTPPLPLRSPSQIVRPHLLHMTTWKKKSEHQPILLFQVVGNFRVHLGLSWVQVETAAVEIDRSLEVLAVAIASHTTFDRHDFAVDAFSDCVSYTVRAVAHDVG